MNDPQATQNSIQVFGIPNCDTVKKARTWLAAQGLDVQFHDFKKQGVPPDAIPKWLAQVYWSILINRKGTTWRQLDDAEKANVTDATTAQALATRLPSVIKRPVVVWAHGDVTVGFNADDWAKRI